MFRYQKADWNNNSQSGDGLGIWLKEMQMDKNTNRLAANVGQKKETKAKKKMER